jgi:hypothetical protein
VTVDYSTVDIVSDASLVQNPYPYYEFLRGYSRGHADHLETPRGTRHQITGDGDERYQNLS